MSDGPTDAYDPLDMWDPSDPGVVTVPIDGMYVAAGGVMFANDDTATPGLPQDNGHRLIQISAGSDEITMAAAQSNEDGTSNTLSTERLAVTWVGPAP